MDFRGRSSPTIGASKASLPRLYLPVVLGVFRGPALRFLCLLHGFALPFGIFVDIFSLLLGRFFGLAAIFSDASILPLRVRRNRNGNAERGKQNENRKSLHGLSERKLPLAILHPPELVVLSWRVTFGLLYSL
jgi:hypothetical protein